MINKELSKNFLIIEEEVNCCFIKYFYENFNKELNFQVSNKEILLLNVNFYNYVVGPNEVFLTKVYSVLKKFLKESIFIKKIKLPEWLDERLFVSHFSIVIIKSLTFKNINSQEFFLNDFIDRADIVSNFNDFSIMYRFKANYDSITRLFFESILFLENLNFIFRKEIKYSASGNNKVSTLIVYRFSIDFIKLRYENFNLFISLSPFTKFADEYLISYSIGTLTFIYKKSKNQLKFNKFHWVYIQKLSETPLSLDKRLLGDYSTIRDEFWLDKNKLTYFEDNLLELKKNQISLNKHIQGMRPVYKKLLLYKTLLSSAFIYNDSLKGDRNISVELDKLIKFYSALFKDIKVNYGDVNLDDSKIVKVIDLAVQKREYFFLLKKTISESSKNLKLASEFSLLDSLIEKNIDIFYFSYYYDFRGRVYSKSPFHPINNRFSRILIKRYKDSYSYENLIKSKYFSVFNNTNQLNFKFLIYKGRYFSLDGFKLLDVFLIKNYLLELGKLNKVELLDTNYFVTLDKFLLEGKNIFENELDPLLSFEDKLHVLKYKRAIYDVLNGNLSPYSILRDATCSSLQHWHFLLNTKNHYKFCINLDSDKWIDTYTYIIHNFIKKNEDDDSFIKFKKFWNRKNLKRSIMTTNYNVTYYRFLKYFFESLRDSGVVLELNLDDYNSLLNFLKKFYNFVLEEFFSLIFLLKKKNIIESFNKGDVVVGGISINFNYLSEFYNVEDSKKVDSRTVYKLSKKIINSFNIKDGVTRTTFVNKRLNEYSLDLKKTNTAFEPNLIQSLDAVLVHHTVINSNIAFPIHDCFGVSIDDLANLIDFHNKYFNNINSYKLEKFDNSIQNHENEDLVFYSIFILL